LNKLKILKVNALIYKFDLLFGQKAPLPARLAAREVLIIQENPATY
jgi:hypothetical protein